MVYDESPLSSALERALADGNVGRGIGTYGEKLIHRTLKFYFEPDESKHEVSCFGSVADIRNDEGIIEIQTRSLNKLTPKLSRFLTEERVTVVFPIVQSKTICRVDTKTGEILAPRKSSKRGIAASALAEISLIRSFIPNDNLKVLVVMLDATETRMINGKIKVGRKRTSKINSVPTRINEIISLSCSQDYRKLLPENLPKSFTALEFEKNTGLKHIYAHGALMLLLQLDILQRERKGREAYVYSIKQ